MGTEPRSILTGPPWHVNIEFLTIVVLGRALLYTIQNVAGKLVIRPKFFEQLVSCDFCLGCWLFFGLMWVFDQRIIGIPHIPILSHFLLGILVSLVVHVFVIGWKTKFETIVIE